MDFKCKFDIKDEHFITVKEERIFDETIKQESSLDQSEVHLPKLDC